MSAAEACWNNFGHWAMRTINLFMWGYQEYFRFEAKYLAKKVLEAIGVDVDPAVFLVGIARPDKTPKHPVCIEPEGERWPLSIFSSLPESVEEAIVAHPIQDMHFGDAPSMLDKPENIRRVAIREEVARHLRIGADGAQVRTYCSNALPIGDYYVVCVVQVPERLFQQFPLISYRWEKEEIGTNFLDQCLLKVLEEVSVAMTRPEPGRFFSGSMRTPNEVVAQAASSFMRVPFIGDFNPSALFEHFNKLSQQRYEGRSGIGRIVLAAFDDPSVQYVLQLAEPVNLRETRWTRKLLQMASNETALIAGYEKIYGIGSLSDLSVPPYSVEFLEHHQWDFKRGDTVLMRTQFGVARLPQEPVSTDRFVDSVTRTFTSISEDAVGRFRRVLDLLAKLPRGSMLIIAEDAAQETARLKRQGTAITPAPLSTALLQHATNIDGTILVDPSGVCHAIGVILDGEANDECTPVRGARYNSAVRYVLNGKAKRMAFVVSEDRTLDVIPILRSKVSRGEIESAVAEIATATVDNYQKVRAWLDDHRFYLNSDQCETVNDALDRIEATSLDVGRVVFQTNRFEPDARMNDSYLKP